ncbi:MAG: primosomal protein N', partial [Firmicutes bacterium HGW-Firmicutes-13]
FKAFKRGAADILIGTQMVAKGLDFPRVTLVGVITADTALNLPDFRAAERTFQLLTQVAGRTGRSSLGGKVIIQTYTPDHYSIVSAGTHDYETFFGEEISLREDFGYPPFSHLLRVVFSGIQEKDLARAAGEFKDALNHYLKESGGEILGPGPCPLPKIKGRYRWHLVLKSKNIGIISKAVKTVWDHIQGKSGSRDIRIILDINPINML